MTQNSSTNDGFFKKILEYVKIRIELYRLNCIKIFVEWLSFFYVRILIRLFAVIAIFFFHLAVLAWLTEVLKKSYFAYLLVGGIYLFFALVFSICSKIIRKYLSNRIIKKLLP